MAKDEKTASIQMHRKSVLNSGSPQVWGKRSRNNPERMSATEVVSGVGPEVCCTRRAEYWRFQSGRSGERILDSSSSRLGVAADAVGFEPVSTAKFPANREKNREFCDFWSESGILAPSQRANSIGYREIPCATEQGIFPAEQGNNFKEQGFSSAKKGARRRIDA